MAAVTVGCHTNKVSKTCLFGIKRRIRCKNTFICMKADSVGCHVDYLYDNQQWRLPCGFFLNRKVLYHFSLSKVIPQKTKFNIEYLYCRNPMSSTRNPTVLHINNSFKKPYFTPTVGQYSITLLLQHRPPSLEDEPWS